MILTGNVALETMGFETFGFGGGRVDAWEPDDDVYWGPETTWLGDERYTGDRELEEPLGAVQMGLIYVNPEGPNGNSRPARCGARHPRDVPPDGDERRGDGGADRRRPQLRQDPRRRARPRASVPSPRRLRSRSRASAGRAAYGSGKGADAITSGIEVTWTTTPTRWSNNFLENLFGYEWELEKSPAGANQWVAKDSEAIIPAPDDGGATRKPTMLTTDLALRFDPIYEPISRRFKDNPDELADAFARAWFKLDAPRHGPGRPLPRPRGSERGPDLAGPTARRSGGGDQCRGRRELKRRILASGLTVSQLVSTAWASASTFRGGDKRGGANGARVRLDPQRSWEVNNPPQLVAVLGTLAGIQTAFSDGGRSVSLADLIVLGGCAAVEQAADEAGFQLRGSVHARPRRRGRQEQTDVESFEALEPARRRIPQLPRRRQPAPGRVSAGRQGQPAHT